MSLAERIGESPDVWVVEGAAIAKESMKKANAGATNKQKVAEWEPPGGKRSRLADDTPKKKRAAVERGVAEMAKKLKDPGESKYGVARAAQMANGESRPPGMSGQFGVAKQRVGQLEAVLYRVFVSTRMKEGV